MKIAFQKQVQRQHRNRSFPLLTGQSNDIRPTKQQEHEIQVDKS